jgi:rod shape determining protein RodA
MFLIDRRYFRYFDWVSFIITFLLASIGLLFIFSATYQPDQPYSVFFQKQAFGLAAGLLIYLILCFMDYRSLMRWGYFLYFGIIGLLIYTMIKGHIGMGGQRWIQLFFIKFQPSELAKLFFPVFASYYVYTQNSSGKLAFKEFIPVLAVLGVSFVLILKQPDLGTALILLMSGGLVLWLANIQRQFIIASMIGALLCAPLANYVLKDYQKKRIQVFMGYGDSKKERYQIEQSKIAIGSGGLTGKGFLNGTQSRLQFLPESRTDFIFSVISEELGLIGALLILILYTLLFFRMLAVIQTIPVPIIQLLAIGLILHIVFSTFINIAMVMGMLPIVGIPLPLISYGVSNLWVTLASLGWFNSIAMRRFYMRKNQQQ